MIHRHIFHNDRLVPIENVRLSPGQAGLLSGYGILDRKSTRLNSSHLGISYAVFCLKKKKVANVVWDRAAAGDLMDSGPTTWILTMPVAGPVIYSIVSKQLTNDPGVDAPSHVSTLYV